MEICPTSPVLILSDTDSNDDDAATLSRSASERFTSSLCTQAEVEALCKKHGVPPEFAAQPAVDRRACTPPRRGAICVYAHALEAGLRFPLHAFFSEALSHFRLAPSQLTPNGWRVLVGFFVLCHSAGVPPSLAVFRHFFSLSSRNGWYGFKCRKGAGALFTGLTSPKSDKEWKRGFFFLTSPEPWACPVRWGEPPSNISTAGPALSSNDKKSVAKLIHKHSAAVDLRTFLSENNLAAAFSSNLAGASPPPPLQLPPSTGSEGSDLILDEAVAPAEKVKAEPEWGTPELSRKKRKLEEVASTKYELRPSERNTPPAAPTMLSMPQVANCEPLGYAMELDENQTATEHDAAALREQLKEMKRVMEAEREKAKVELAAAKQAAETAVESAKTAAVQQFLGSKEYTRLVAEQTLAAYERGAEVMKNVALRLNPRLDAAKLLLPLPLD
ncbi:hypothetical protein QYE76_028341 [Lolium multiflorum]|uniref:Transposase (putative) gypsy type domain-containing protein n=1 Tax=Lolium multiflorum TaxID=4521 RepID=A0AAD8VH35_LOLMU|nr:hypothetical protein QYE76_028341 [Lolium multiflorum]